MAFTNEYRDLLYAYALGCLDKKDILKLRQFIMEGGEYPLSEVGEYQSLVSLLPSILNIESPRPQLKDKVARKLYRIKQQNVKKRSIDDSQKIQGKPPGESTSHTVDKLTGNRKIPSALDSSPNIDNIPSESVSNKLEPDISDNFISNRLKTKTNDFEEVIPRRKTVELFRPNQDTQIKERKPKHETDIGSSKAGNKSGLSVNNNEQTVIENLPAKKSENLILKSKGKKKYGKSDEESSSIKRNKSKSPIVFILIILILLIGMAAIYLKVSSDVKTYRSDIKNLDMQLTDLSQKVTLNQELQNILSTKDLRIVNLKGAKTNPEGFGKLIISLNQGKGFLQVNNMPKMGINQAFQLWVTVNGGVVSLGVFNPKNKQQYYPFSIPELSNKKTTIFFLTEEPSTGSQKPSKKVILTGKLM